jgi:hypothetical protein
MITPNIIDAERAIVGTALSEPKRVLPKLLALRLTPEHFTDLTQRKAYAAAIELHAAGRPIDALTVGEAAKLDAALLSDQVADSPPFAHAAHHAKALLDAAAKRKLAALADNVGRQARNGRPTDELVALMQEGLLAVAPEAKAIAAEQDSVELKARLFAIMLKLGQTIAERNASMAQAVLEALHARGRFFHHGEYRDHATAMYFDTRRKLLLHIADSPFQSWLADYIGVNRTDRTFAFIFAAVEDATLNDPRSIGLLPDTYWARRGDAIYLSNGDGLAVKITAGKVETVDNGTNDVLFAAGRTLRPWTLTTPADPFAACRVFAGMKAATSYGLDLLRLWATALPSGQRCKPPLVLAGAVGSGKTRTALGLQELFGLPPRIIVPTEAGETDFWTSLDAGGLLVLDNADTRLRWLADALAAAATDGSREKRRLYSNSEIVQHRARAWVCVTSANPTFGADAGLADRLLVERLDRREADTAESALSDEIAAARDAGLSWIAHVLADALADEAPVPGNLNRRHPDFADLAVRIGRAIGREAQAVAALGAAEADKSVFNLECDEAGAALLALIEAEGSFTGTAAELVPKLPELNPDYWTAKRLGKRLNRIWPHVASVFKATAEKGHGGVLTYAFRPNGGFGGFQTPYSPKVL